LNTTVKDENSILYTGDARGTDKNITEKNGCMADLTQQNPIKPDQIIEIVLRYKWLIILFLSVSLTIGLVKTMIADRTYEASTLILVQPQKVPRNYIQSVVSTDIEARISTISQQIMSRSNLEKIIDQFGLYQNREDMYMEDKVEGLRKRINVNINRARQGSEAFSIKFKGTSPERVMRIANTLASYFMDENLKVREAQAVGTTEFLESELEKTRKKLKAREERLSEYRAKHLGGLPDELEANLRTLDRLQTQHTDKLAALRDARNNLAALQNQIAQQKEMASQSFDTMFEETGFEEDAAFLSEEEQKIESLKEELDTLLLKYTKKHPDVVKLENTIAKLEKQKAEKQKENAALDAAQAENTESLQSDMEIPEPEEGGSDPLGTDFMAMQQDMQLKQAKNDIARIQSEIRAIDKKMNLYQQRVEQTPKREQDLQELKRDYANIQDVYTSLLDRKLEAELSMNMEKKQKGEQFRILDHARVPQKPISPDVKKAFVIYFGAGGALAGGIIFLLFIFDNAVRRDEDIEEEFGLPILAEIAPIREPAEVLKEKLKTAAFVLVSAYTALVIGFFLILNSYGIDRAVDAMKSYINL